MNNKHISKYLSLVLRHQPENLGITLDKGGWASVPELLEKMQQKGMPIDLPRLQEIVDTNDKKRFAFSNDKKKIRASQGHSVEIDLGLEPVIPPAVLYHGTAVQTLSAIMEEGIQARSRQWVHLSADTATARQVGSRHGRPAVLLVKSGEMQQAGHSFYQAANGVWLTAQVPTAYLIPINEQE